MCRGVPPIFLLALTSHSFNRRSTTSMCPHEAAMRRGVHPSISLAALTSHSGSFNRRSTTSTCPHEAAMCRGVPPIFLLALTSHSFNRRSTTSMCPREAARRRGVHPSMKWRVVKLHPAAMQSSASATSLFQAACWIRQRLGSVALKTCGWSSSCLEVICLNRFLMIASAFICPYVGSCLFLFLGFSAASFSSFIMFWNRSLFANLKFSLVIT